MLRYYYSIAQSLSSHHTLYSNRKRNAPFKCTILLFSKRKQQLEDFMKVTLDEIHSLTSQFYVAKGEVYLKERLVEFISVTSYKVTAYVIGTKAYTVSLRRIEQTLEGWCTCPAFENARVCKHLAATGLALVKYHEGSYEPSAEYFEKAAFFRCWQAFIH